jgi:hypothetical protein
VYRLPIKENKLLFSVPVCSKQTEVCRFRFLFAANKTNLYEMYTVLSPKSRDPSLKQTFCKENQRRLKRPEQLKILGNSKVLPKN